MRATSSSRPSRRSRSSSARAAAVVSEIGTRARPGDRARCSATTVFLELQVKVRPQVAPRRGDARAARHLTTRCSRCSTSTARSSSPTTRSRARRCWRRSADLVPVDPPDDAARAASSIAGRAAKRIARLVLERRGNRRRGRRRAPRTQCCRRASRPGTLTMLAAADTSVWQDGAGCCGGAEPRCSDAGVRLALLTGNPEPMARARSSGWALERFFARGPRRVRVRVGVANELLALLAGAPAAGPRTRRWSRRTRRDEQPLVVGRQSRSHVEAGDLSGAPSSGC